MSKLNRLRQAYAPHEHRPLGGYLGSMALHASTIAALALIARLTGRRMPQRPAPSDVVLVSVGTHKLARLLAKNTVTSPIRAPFTSYERPIGSGEVMEQVRDEGSAARHTVGELLSCPFCTGVWVATGLTAGLVLAPRLTRLVATGATAVAVSDFLQMAYVMAQQAAEQPRGAAEEPPVPAAVGG